MARVSGGQDVSQAAAVTGQPGGQGLAATVLAVLTAVTAWVMTRNAGA